MFINFRMVFSSKVTIIDHNIIHASKKKYFQQFLPNFALFHGEPLISGVIFFNFVGFTDCDTISTHVIRWYF